ncbi:hypothetical protein ANMWB30_32100 [Arthrobacter sp. MWB30]|nr:hypothetical protein ANMWB30_32100 [Arthrobacter sp. MWB30]
MGFNLDPDTRHYPDRDTKKRLNNSSSMAEIRSKGQSARIGHCPAPANWG